MAVTTTTEITIELINPVRVRGSGAVINDSRTLKFSEARFSVTREQVLAAFAPAIAATDTAGGAGNVIPYFRQEDDNDVGYTGIGQITVVNTVREVTPVL